MYVFLVCYEDNILLLNMHVKQFRKKRNKSGMFSSFSKNRNICRKYGYSYNGQKMRVFHFSLHRPNRCLIRYARNSQNKHNPCFSSGYG